MKLHIYTIAVSILALVTTSNPYVWQNKEHLVTYMKKYFHEAHKIPARKATAARITKYFLNRNVPGLGNLRTVESTSAFSRIYDVVFLIDSSSSVNKHNFKRGLKALRKLIDKGLPDTHYAAISFSNHAKLQFSFMDKNNAKKNLKKIAYYGGRTNTQEALFMTFKDLLFNRSSHIRHRSIRRILLITDGLSNVRRHLTLFRGFQLKSVGVEVFVMAIGRYRYGFEEILGLASSTYGHLYRVGHMKGFLKVAKIIPSWPFDATEEKTWLAAMKQKALTFRGKI